MHRRDTAPDARIDRFLTGRMTEDERLDFELRMLEDDGLFEEVVQGEALREALRGEAARGDFAAPVARRFGGVPMPSVTQWLRQPFSMAACLLLALSIVLHVFDEGADTGTAIPVPSFALLEATRAADGGARVHNPGPHLLQVDVGFSDALAFDVALTATRDGRTVFHETGLRPDGQGWLRLVVRTLPPATYRLTVTWAGEEQEYLLAVEEGLNP